MRRKPIMNKEEEEKRCGNTESSRISPSPMRKLGRKWERYVIMWERKKICRGWWGGQARYYSGER